MLRLHRGGLISWGWHKRIEVPQHASRCNYCDKCVLGGGSEVGEVAASARRRILRHEGNEVRLGGVEGADGGEINKCGSVRCAVCYGCEHVLEEMEERISLFNTSFEFSKGTTHAGVYWVEDPSKPQLGKKSVVKLWGLPLWNQKLKKYMKCKPDSGQEKLKV